MLSKVLTDFELCYVVVRFLIAMECLLCMVLWIRVFSWSQPKASVVRRTLKNSYKSKWMVLVETSNMPRYKNDFRSQKIIHVGQKGKFMSYWSFLLSKLIFQSIELLFLNDLAYWNCLIMKPPKFEITKPQTCQMADSLNLDKHVVISLLLLLTSL